MEHFSVYITRLNAVCDPKGRRVGYPEKKSKGTKRKSQFQNNSLTLCFSTRQRSFKLLHITGTSDNSKSN